MGLGWKLSKVANYYEDYFMQGFEGLKAVHAGDYQPVCVRLEVPDEGQIGLATIFDVHKRGLFALAFVVMLGAADPR